MPRHHDAISIAIGLFEQTPYILPSQRGRNRFTASRHSVASMAGCALDSAMMFEVQNAPVDRFVKHSRESMIVDGDTGDTGGHRVRRVEEIACRFLKSIVFSCFFLFLGGHQDSSPSDCDSSLQTVPRLVADLGIDLSCGVHLCSFLNALKTPREKRRKRNDLMKKEKS